MDNSGANSIKNSGSRLTAVESEVIQLFVQLSRAVGQPRSFAEIYGLLFVSHLPLTLDELEERLQISRGSAFRGLQFLKELGAVREVKIAKSRRMHFEAVAELRNLAGSFLSKQVSTHLGDSATRLEKIKKNASSLSGAAQKKTLERLTLLQSWESNARQILPFLLEMLGSKES